MVIEILVIKEALAIERNCNRKRPKGGKEEIHNRKFLREITLNLTLT